jgi:hypothetical protein
MTGITSGGVRMLATVGSADGFGIVRMEERASMPVGGKGRAAWKSANRDLLREANSRRGGTWPFDVGTEHVLLATTKQSEKSFARRVLDEVGAGECSG